jgi:hypothetical protein
MRHVRAAGALAANAGDASIWRWFALLLEEIRIRCAAVTVGSSVCAKRHVATDSGFDKAIRSALEKVEGTKPTLLQRVVRSRRVT